MERLTPHSEHKSLCIIYFQPYLYPHNKKIHLLVFLVKKRSVCSNIMLKGFGIKFAHILQRWLF